MSDIVWEHLRYYDKTLSWIKSIFLSILLFILCIVVVTPLTLLDKLTPIRKAVTAASSSNEIGDEYFVPIVTAYFSPLIFFMFNFILVPFIIE